MPNGYGVLLRQEFKEDSSSSMSCSDSDFNQIQKIETILHGIFEDGVLIVGQRLIISRH